MTVRLTPLAGALAWAILATVSVWQQQKTIARLTDDAQMAFDQDIAAQFGNVHADNEYTQALLRLLLSKLDDLKGASMAKPAKGLDL